MTTPYAETQKTLKKLTRKAGDAWLLGRGLTDREILIVIDLLQRELESRKIDPTTLPNEHRQDGPQPQRVEIKRIGNKDYNYLRFDWKGKKRSWYLKGWEYGNPIPFITFDQLDAWEQAKADKLRAKESTDDPLEPKKESALDKVIRERQEYLASTQQPVKYAP